MKKGWEVKKLGEVCEIKTGKKDVNQGNPNGEFPFFTCAREHTYSDEFSFDTEALLIAGNGDVGTVSYYKGKFEAYQRTYVLFNFKDISPRFLFLILDGYLKQTVSKQKLGNTMPYIKMGMLADFEIPLPPFSEQEYIVSVLDEAFVALEKAKENAENNLQNSRELFESYLQSIFANPGDGWENKKLGEVCEDVEYGTSAKSFKTGKIPVLRMGNIQCGKLDWNDLVYTSDDEEIQKYALKKDDILFNRTNSEELVGKTVIYKGERPAIFAGYLIRINIKKDLVDADFLNICLNSRKLREYGFSVMTSSVNQANISGSKLKEYPVVLPPLSEQKRIVAKLDALSAETKKLETIYQQKLADLEELKKSILQKAFNGEFVGACS